MSRARIPSFLSVHSHSGTGPHSSTSSVRSVNDSGLGDCEYHPLKRARVFNFLSSHSHSGRVLHSSSGVRSVSDLGLGGCEYHPTRRARIFTSLSSHSHYRPDSHTQDIECATDPGLWLTSEYHHELVESGRILTLNSSHDPGCDNKQT